VFDAVLVWSAAVFDTPEDGLGSAAGIDFAVDRADEGLHGVGAEVGHLATTALLLPWVMSARISGLSIAETYAPPGPVNAHGAAPAWRNVAGDHLAGMHSPEHGDQHPYRQCR
jgi:hypothetical protein